MQMSDWLTIGLWLAVILVLLGLAWEPYRQTRNRLSISLEGVNQREVSPLYIFTLPFILAIGPFAAQVITHPRGFNVWLRRHLLMPFGLLHLGMFLAIQLGLRNAVLKAAIRARERRAALVANLEQPRD